MAEFCKRRRQGAATRGPPIGNDLRLRRKPRPRHSNRAVYPCQRSTPAKAEEVHLMTTKEAAWRHPVHGAMVILPDGHVMTGNRAREQGWKIEDFPANVAKTATAHPHDADKVIIARGATA